MIKEYKNNSIKLIKGDCLEKLKDLDNESIDLVLADPPYGTIKGLGAGSKIQIDRGDKSIFNKSEWDVVIDIEKLFIELNRVLKRNGRLVLFCQEPFTSKLIQYKSKNPNFNNLVFNYRMIWLKKQASNVLSAPKSPMGYFEDICVFTKNHDSNKLHPLRPYSKQVFQYIGLNLKGINNTLKNHTAQQFFNFDGFQFSLCTEKTYNLLIEKFKINKMPGFKTYDELKQIDLKYKTYPTFNLPKNKNSRSNVLNFDRPSNNNRWHPTQKPTDLLNELIDTYSNKNDVVLDFSMGSASCAISALMMDRKFIGMELDDDFYNLSCERVEKYLKDGFDRRK